MTKSATGEDEMKQHLNRMLKQAAGGALFAALLGSAAGIAQAEPADTLRVMHAGGQWGDAVSTCIDKPFEEETGIKVVIETPGGFAKFKAMLESGTITNVMTDFSTADLYRGMAEGMLEPIDWAAINPDPMFDEARHDYAAGTSYFSTIMAWRDDAKAPSDFVEFFDTENFPGIRALPDYPDYVLAFAAMGDGVPMDEIFPIDLDRAFATLERIKDDTIWWQAGAQAPQLLQDNEAQYAISWSGRVAGQEGVTVSFNQGMLDISWFVMAKGTPQAEKEAAWLWLHEHMKATRQACVAQYISYPGPSPDLDPLLPQDRLDEFPTYGPNKEVQWLIDGQWWFDHAAEVEQRWNEFKLSQ
jgi:putative spermidine/putrescine transport system substrate-binding protein